MHFVRKKKRGQSQKVRRSWFTQDGYRILWRREVWGVRVPPRFQACVRIEIPATATADEAFANVGLRERQASPLQDHEGRPRGLRETPRLWTKACEATGVRDLHDIFGKLPLGMPLWVKKKINRKAYALLMEEA